jgi:hypothetical protein
MAIAAGDRCWHAARVCRGDKRLSDQMIFFKILKNLKNVFVAAANF